MIALVLSLLTGPVLAAGPPSAKELLEKYGANLDKQISFIAKFETTGTGSSSLSSQGRGRTRTLSSAGEVRYDGHRLANHIKLWGHIRDGYYLPSREQAHYRSDLWDGESQYQYEQCAFSKDKELRVGYLTILATGRTPEAKAALRAKPPLPFASAETSLLSGYFEDDSERLDRVLLGQSKSLSVRPKAENVNGVACYVIDAGTRRGKYTVWIDPQHGYQTTRVAVARRGGDEALRSPNYRIAPKETIDTTVDYTRFDNVDGVWIVVEAKKRGNRVFALGGYHRHATTYRMISFQLNPDHQALRSFMPDDVLDGANVYQSEWWGKKGADRLVWWKGEVMPREQAERAGLGKETTRPATTRPSARAARTDTRPAAGEGDSGKMTGTR